MILEKYFRALVVANRQVRIQELEEELVLVESIAGRLSEKHEKDLLTPLKPKIEGLRLKLDQKIKDLLP